MLHLLNSVDFTAFFHFYKKMPTAFFLLLTLVLPNCVPSTNRFDPDSPDELQAPGILQGEV